MNILIVGGGLVATNLISLLIQNTGENDRITVIEADLKNCERIANLYEVEVFHGDGSNIAVLQACGLEHCELFLALTGQDEVNLIACQLAKAYGQVRSPLCRVNNPKNIDTIRRLGITNTFSSSLILAQMLSQEIDHSGLYIVYALPNSNTALVEFNLRADIPEIGMELKDISFPNEARIVLITPKGQPAYPANGDSVLGAGDRVMMVCEKSDFNLIRARFVDQESSVERMVSDLEQHLDADER